MGWLRERRRQRVLRQRPVSAARWEQVCGDWPLLGEQPAPRRERLRDLAALWLAEKRIEPVQGAELDEPLRVATAALACLPVLELGLDWYRGWVTVVVYPGEFIAPREEMDEAGVVHHRREVLAGEASPWGPVVLSVSGIEESRYRDGYNVVIHEMAHKLDMLTGAADGCPPLPPGLGAAWAADLGAAYAGLQAQVDGGEETPIDPYAAEHPAEFFAVMSEYFFEYPERVAEPFPEVYRHLAAFYRQDPMAY